MQLLEQTESFFFQGGDIGCLLIHGFTGTPKEMRGIGEFLAARGLTVCGVRLAGHGTSPEQMAETGWRDWLSSAEVGFEQLQSCCHKLFVIGLSMGGTLALNLAASYPKKIRGVVSICAPVFLKDRRLYLLPILRYLRKYVDADLTDIIDPAARSEHIHYERVPVACIHQLLILMRRTRHRLARIQAATLVIQARGDSIIPPQNAEFIYENVGSKEKTIYWAENSGHVVTLDHDREAVNTQILAFINSYR